MKPGDTIVVHFKVGGPNAIKRLPQVNATILAVEPDALRVRNAEDAELFAGLIGLIRLPRNAKGWEARQAEEDEGGIA